MIPHERSLVEKWKDKPFAILGVNSDSTSTEDGMKLYREKQKEHSVTWRSFRNESTEPAISDVWHVQGWPTLYCIDQNGVIRQKIIGADEQAVDKALTEMLAAVEQPAEMPAQKPAGGGKK
ncbi:MAG TPA: hypothetical protein VFZ65_14755 [Planctomycetota bacterium]|nr:hypothetical protein [Planctomycetota bacterium]